MIGMLEVCVEEHLECYTAALLIFASYSSRDRVSRTESIVAAESQSQCSNEAMTVTEWLCIGVQVLTDPYMKQLWDEGVNRF